MEKESKNTCGVVMPISMTDTCAPEHWQEVKEILFEVIRAEGLEPCLVSDSDESGVIQRRIVQNLYSNDLVVCDVSGKNANVMFELGLRLAFDKPTIVVKDDATDYLFDTGIIEHLGYPRGLRFKEILRFKEKLAQKISATLDAASKDPNYSTFLKNFGDYKVAHLEQREVTGSQLILVQLEELRRDVARLNRQINRPSHGSALRDRSASEVTEPMPGADRLVKDLVAKFLETKGISEVEAFEHERELFEYLESHEEVQRACRTKKNLQRLMLDSLIPF